jgi:hypothetical protein
MEVAPQLLRWLALLYWLLAVGVLGASEFATGAEKICWRCQLGPVWVETDACGPLFCAPAAGAHHTCMRC